MVNIDDVIAAARLPEKTVVLCLRGDLQAQWEELERRLGVVRERPDEPLGGHPEERELAEKMEAIREEMRSHEVTFRFRGMGSKAYSDLLLKHRADNNDDGDDQAADGLNWKTYTIALVAACAIDPVMSEVQVDKLTEVIHGRAWDELVGAALVVNQSQVSVPFSLAGSAIRAATAPSSKQPEPGEFLALASSDESLAG